MKQLSRLLTALLIASFSLSASFALAQDDATPDAADPGVTAQEEHPDPMMENQNSPAVKNEKKHKKKKAVKHAHKNKKKHGKKKHKKATA